METELKECRDKIKKSKTPKHRNKFKRWEELRKGHLWKVEVKDVQHGHATLAFRKDWRHEVYMLWPVDASHGSVEKHARWEARVWTEECFLNQAMSEETWYIHKSEPQPIGRHARVHTADPNTSRYSQGEACGGH